MAGKKTKKLKKSKKLASTKTLTIGSATGGAGAGKAEFNPF